MLHALRSLVAIFLLFSAGTAEAQFGTPAPSEIYRDPCTTWGTWDYGYGSASLLRDDDMIAGIGSIGPAFTRDIDVYESGVVIATIRVTQPYGGVATFAKLAQYREGTFSLEIEGNNYSAATYYEDFHEYLAPNAIIKNGVQVAAAGTPIMHARALSGVCATIKVTIELDHIDFMETYYGEAAYMEYVTERNAYYRIN